MAPPGAGGGGAPPPDGGGAGEGPGEDWPADCPVRPLGHRQGVYLVLSPSGELRQLEARALATRAGLLSLFDGAAGMLAALWPELARGGRPSGGFEADRAAAALMRACVAEGLWDATLQVRGPGVWPAGKGGIACHCGDAVWLDGVWQRAGLRRADALYAAAPRTPRPAKADPGTGPGRALLAATALWNFEAGGPAGELWVGWLGQALLGAAPAWRVHLLVTGSYGTGKSGLYELARAALGGQAAAEAQSVTEAGLRYQLSGEARAIALDEQEHEPSGRVDDLVRLIRLASGKAGAKALRATPGGRVLTSHVSGAAYLSAILPPALEPQDKSRFLQLRLDPLPQAGGDAAEAARRAVDRAMTEAAAASPALRARMLHGWPAYQAAVEAFRAAAAAQGADARAADLLAALLAGLEVLTEEGEPSGERAAQQVERFRWVLGEATADRAEDGEGQRCWVHLMTSASDLWRSGERRSVASELTEGLWADDGAHARRALEQMGLKVVERRWPDGRTLHAVLVATKHQGLERVFAGSNWAGGRWTTALLQLPGAYPWSRVEAAAPRFAGVAIRATAVPEAFWPEWRATRTDDLG